MSRARGGDRSRALASMSAWAHERVSVGPLGCLHAPVHGGRSRGLPSRRRACMGARTRARPRARRSADARQHVFLREARLWPLACLHAPRQPRTHARSWACERAAFGTWRVARLRAFAITHRCLCNRHLPRVRPVGPESSATTRRSALMLARAHAWMQARTRARLHAAALLVRAAARVSDPGNELAIGRVFHAAGCPRTHGCTLVGMRAPIVQNVEGCSSPRLGSHTPVLAQPISHVGAHSRMDARMRAQPHARRC